MKRLSVSVCSGCNDQEAWVETRTRYRLVVEGVRVAILATRVVYENSPTEFRVDFWTPKTRWKTDGMHRWEHPTSAFKTISEAITRLYEEALNQGDILVVEGACERRAALYLRLARRLLAWRFGYEIVPLEGGELPGFLVVPVR